MMWIASIPSRPASAASICKTPSADESIMTISASGLNPDRIWSMSGTRLSMKTIWVWLA